MAMLALLVALAFSSGSPQQEDPPILQGAWIATAGTRTLRGAWSGQALPGRTDAAHGSWTLDSDTGARLMQGTWSAEKRRLRWEGTWAARSAAGRTYTGTWSAYMPGTSAKTLADMLAATQDNEVAGSWRYRGLQGGWWLKSAPPKEGPR